MAKHLYTELKTRYRDWEELAVEEESTLAEILRPAGFAVIRSKYIIQSLRKIRNDTGECNLNFLSGWTEEKALDYLCSLPGVSNKVARCIMLYTLGFNVLPVDAHVYRIARRLGWTTKKRADLSHAELESKVPEKLRYGLHVNAVAHGRNVCHATNPKCGECCIAKYCPYDKVKDQRWK